MLQRIIPGSMFRPIQRNCRIKKKKKRGLDQKIKCIFSEMFAMKTKFDESENVAIRATRVVTDKIQDTVGRTE